MADSAPERVGNHVPWMLAVQEITAICATLEDQVRLANLPREGMAFELQVASTRLHGIVSTVLNQLGM